MVEKRQTEKTGLKDDLNRVQKRVQQLEHEAATASSSQPSPQPGLNDSSSGEGEQQQSTRRRAGTITSKDKSTHLQRPESAPRSYSDSRTRNKTKRETSPVPGSDTPFRTNNEPLTRIESTNSSHSEASIQLGPYGNRRDDESPSKMKTPVPARDRTRSTDTDNDTPTGKRSQPGLLPPPTLNTPTADKRLNAESRIAFDPEVREYLALAQTPPPAREGFPSIPGPSRLGPGLSPSSNSVPSRLNTPPLGGGLPILIPGSPYSDATDAKSLVDNNGLTTPDSVKVNEMINKSERNDAMSVTSAPEVRLMGSNPDMSALKIRSGHDTQGGRTRLNPAENVVLGNPMEGRRGSEPTQPDVIQRQDPSPHPTGLKSAQIPRLTPRLLPYTRCSIPSSRIVPNTLGKEALSFVVSIQLRPPGDLQVHNWNVAKFFSSFVELDVKMRQKMNKKEIKQAKLASLPEGRAWKEYGPAKMDRMKVSHIYNLGLRPDAYNQTYAGHARDLYSKPLGLCAGRQIRSLCFLTD
jgi:hypothetical protein